MVKEGVRGCGGAQAPDLMCEGITVFFSLWFYHTAPFIDPNDMLWKNGDEIGLISGRNSTGPIFIKHLRVEVPI
jgi:hypothetical protein